MTDLAFLTIAEASALIQARKLSPVDLTKVFIERVKRLDGKLNAFILLMEESALAEAAKAEAEIAAGGWKGPLHGIPIGLKDIYNTAGVATTGHSALFKDHVPSEDAVTVAKLRAAGAVILGKLATHEFATGGPCFDLPWPPARNPWNLDHIPGGSSSGSGAAIAAGLCTGSMGTDTGGSIRWPAAMCGIAGHKPTYGLVSRRGILPLSFSLDHGGPMCWTAEDCALMMQALAGHDPLDPASAKVPLPDFAGALGGGLKGLKIGAIRHFFETDLETDPEMVAAFDASLDVLKGLGATVETVTVSPLQHYADTCNLISRAEAFAIHERWITKTPELYGEITRRRIMAGAFLDADVYVNAMRHRGRLVAEMAAVLGKVDLVVTPGWHRPAPTFEDAVIRGPIFTAVFNVTGSPALSVCNGFSKAGLPLSLQIAGRPFEDALVLKAGDAYEKATDFRSLRPAFATAAPAAIAAE
ncbi:amidase [Prosthecomicrobium sp. N25]|uniref:amidase n=1 Tax=Prosthecomicrobium sp. N25 TaxID=3129254 RepID=UPI003076E8BA